MGCDWDFEAFVGWDLGTVTLTEQDRADINTLGWHVYESYIEVFDFKSIFYFATLDLEMAKVKVAMNSELGTALLDRLELDEDELGVYTHLTRIA